MGCFLSNVSISDMIIEHLVTLREVGILGDFEVISTATGLRVGGLRVA